MNGAAPKEDFVLRNKNHETFWVLIKKWKYSSDYVLSIFQIYNKF